jgi:hypothetical protein
MIERTVFAKLKSCRWIQIFCTISEILSADDADRRKYINLRRKSYRSLMYVLVELTR